MASELKETQVERPAEKKLEYQAPNFESHDPLDSVTQTTYFYTFVN